jgi:hypothetical protein
MTRQGPPRNLSASVMQSSRIRDRRFAKVNRCNDNWIAILRAISGRREGTFRMQNSRKRSAFHTLLSTVLNGANTTLR